MAFLRFEWGLPLAPTPHPPPALMQPSGARGHQFCEACSSGSPGKGKPGGALWQGFKPEDSQQI
eukprot:15465202-Alexandrium_andersonii.AAC.1